MHKTGLKHKSARGSYGASPPRAKLSIQIASPQPDSSPQSPSLPSQISQSMDGSRPRVLPELKRFPLIVPKLLVTEENEVRVRKTNSARRNHSARKGRKHDSDCVSLLFQAYLRTNSILNVPLCPALARETRGVAPTYVKYFSPKAEKARARTPQRWDTNEGLLLVNSSAFRKQRRNRRSQSRVE